MERTITGLELFCDNFPDRLKDARLGILCHAASIDASYRHCIDRISRIPGCRIGAIFGPQHGLFGQTQDNMVEWEDTIHPVLNVPVFSLYGAVRKPDSAMLAEIDALVIDLQDVGARPYTYLWTMKLCMEACGEAGIPVWVLDRPNPIAAIGFDGPVLSPEYFSFVGGAAIPLCHRMTIGEAASLLGQEYCSSTELHVVSMRNWHRNSVWSDTGLPWVLPSPNMPTLDTALVYPGMVLLEATNLSEGRGTTRPFELIGAPYLDAATLITWLKKQPVSGCIFREHNFIPAFQKWKDRYCRGIQIHITSIRDYRPVSTTVALLAAVVDIAGDRFTFNNPPYEYETEKMPFDILSGDDTLRNLLVRNRADMTIRDRWKESYRDFLELFDDIALYPE
ncbi:MAG: DUF1343 domain-containing protein [Chitinivibrionales bacterium]|nr:DUF1343 domain-containing protein [Chitinivibrionales bacterium]